jgi:hypothetical protein
MVVIVIIMATLAAFLSVSPVGYLRYFTNQYASAVKKSISIANTSGPHIFTYFGNSSHAFRKPSCLTAHGAPLYMNLNTSIQP